MKLSFPPSARSKPLLAAATLAFLTGCAHNGDFLSSPLQSLSALLGGKSAQTQESGNAEPAANPTTASAPAQRASTPATQVAAATTVTPPKPAAPPKPAPPPIKDMGFFGNFEIGAGFGAQKASGIGGVVQGVNDGADPNRLRAGRKVQTLEGEEYTVEFLGDSNRENVCVSSDKPHHRIKVTSPVFVRFNVENTHANVEIQGAYLAACNVARYRDALPLELLPGDYAIYVGDSGNYTLTLTEAPAPYPVESKKIIARPGFKQEQAASLALPSAYRKSPLARPVELQVTAPMFLEMTANFDVKNKDNGDAEFSIVNDDNGEKIESYGPDYPFYLEPGSYKIFGEISLYRTSGWSKLWGNRYPTLVGFVVREVTEFQAQHIVLDKNFTGASFSGYYHPHAAMSVKIDLNRKENSDYCRSNLNSAILDSKHIHKLTVTVPQMVTIMRKISDGTKWSSGHFFLRQIAGEQTLFCSRGISLMDNREQLSVFLKPGEYELYVDGLAGRNNKKDPNLYTISISSSNKQ